MLGAASAAANFWYIEDLSNGTLAPFSKRSLSSPSSPEKRDSSISTFAKRAILFPLANLEPLIDAFQEVFGLNLTQIAYATFPNPFPSIKSKNLLLADGSEAGQSIPLWSQIQPARKPSFIVAWDDDQDQAPYSWNNGTNLYNTYIQAQADGIPFPIVPPPTTFIHNNYTTKPAFFGCDASLTTTKSTDSPIIFYMTNSPYSAYTNFSFFQTATSFSQMNDIFENGFNQITQGNSTLDPEWPQCLGCAVVERSLAKVGMSRTKQCESCFQKYCWDGTVYEGEVGVVDLPLVLDPSLSFAEWNKTHDFGGGGI
jgi:lysophospholipase